MTPYLLNKKLLYNFSKQAENSKNFAKVIVLNKH